MINTLSKIFKEYPSAANSFDGEKELMFFSLVGVFEIAIFFIIIGIVATFFLDKTMPKEAYTERRRATSMFGLALLCCGISRVFDLISVWHNYAILNAIFRNLTGCLAILTLAYIPFVIKAVEKIRTLEDIHKKMEQTEEKVDRLSDMSKQLIERK